MSKLQDWTPLKPFLSVIIIVFTLFGLVFLKMEERRMGYLLLQMTREQRKLVEEKRMREMTLTKVTRPAQVERAAKNMTLRKVQANQIIHLSGMEPQFASAPEGGDLN